MTLKNLKANLDKDGALRFAEMPQINEGENISATLCITLDDGFTGQSQAARYYLEFKRADGKKYVTAQIKPTDGKLVYALPNCVLAFGGGVKTQVVIKTDDGYVFKSQTAEFFVSSSINATLPASCREDFLSTAQRLFKEVQDGQATLKSVVDEVTNKLADGSFVGSKGEKGDPGFVTWGVDGAVSQGNLLWEVF